MVRPSCSEAGLVAVLFLVFEFMEAGVESPCFCFVLDGLLGSRSFFFSVFLDSSMVLARLWFWKG